GRAFIAQLVRRSAVTSSAGLASNGIMGPLQLLRRGARSLRVKEPRSGRRPKPSGRTARPPAGGNVQTPAARSLLGELALDLGELDLELGYSSIESLSLWPQRGQLALKLTLASRPSQPRAHIALRTRRLRRPKAARPLIDPAAQRLALENEAIVAVERPDAGVQPGADAEGAACLHNRMIACPEIMSRPAAIGAFDGDLRCSGSGPDHQIARREPFDNRRSERLSL